MPPKSKSKAHILIQDLLQAGLEEMAEAACHRARTKGRCECRGPLFHRFPFHVYWLHDVANDLHFSFGKTRLCIFRLAAMWWGDLGYYCASFSNLDFFAGLKH